jgi:hypothetical protein
LAVVAVDIVADVIESVSGDMVVTKSVCQG